MTATLQSGVRVTRRTAGRLYQNVLTRNLAEDLCKVRFKALVRRDEETKAVLCNSSEALWGVDAALVQDRIDRIAKKLSDNFDAALDRNLAPRSGR